MRFVVFTAVNIKVAVFLDVTPCSLADASSTLKIEQHVPPKNRYHLPDYTLPEPRR
jgi:hypothetical protein